LDWDTNAVQGGEWPVCPRGRKGAEGGKRKCSLLQGGEKRAGLLGVEVVKPIWEYDVYP